jgi:hypothetical protein
VQRGEGVRQLVGRKQGSGTPAVPPADDEELTERVAGSTVFSKLDLAWGYLQLELAEECHYVTAFVSHEGVFQWRSLPFGLAAGPSAFQQVVRHMTDQLPGCVHILDDILCYGRDMAEHDTRLRAILDRLAKYGATLRVDKCVLDQPEVDFNGHRVSANGVRPLQSNVEALERTPAPTNRRQLSEFVGTSTYYSKFVPRFADLCQSFRPLLKSNGEWAWSADCQQAFDTIKAKIASPPTLACFDVSADETLVTCDASATALGASFAESQRRRATNRVCVTCAVAGGAQVFGRRARGACLLMGMRALAFLFIWPSLHSHHRSSGFKDTVDGWGIMSSRSASASVERPTFPVHI